MAAKIVFPETIPLLSVEHVPRSKAIPRTAAVVFVFVVALVAAV